MAGNAIDPGRSITSKLVGILTAFCDGNRLSLSELARRTSIPVSTTHRFVHEMADLGLLTRDRDGAFRPGWVVQQLRYTPVRRPTLQERAPLLVDDLVEALRRPVRLGILDGLHVAYIGREPGHTPTTSFTRTARLPVHATALGKALLAFAPADVVRRVVTARLPAYTGRTMTRPDQLLHALHLVRRDGIAVTRGELNRDCHAIAVPVLDGDSVARAAIEVQVDDIDGETSAAVTPPLRLGAAMLNRELGPDWHHELATSRWYLRSLGSDRRPARRSGL